MTDHNERLAQFNDAVQSHVKGFRAAETPEEGAGYVLQINDLVLRYQFCEQTKVERVQGIIDNILKPATDVEKESVHRAKLSLGMSGYGSP